jgi:dolichol-phosphate mannosyltransferase
MTEYLSSPWIVIPTYNEAGNVEPMAQALKALNFPNLHLLFVDDDSPDGTGALIDTLVKRYSGEVFALHRKGERGLGRAYVAGFGYALDQGATAVVQMDCDFSHQPKDVPHLLNALAEADLVIGSRYVEGGGVDPSWSLNRKALSSWANFYARTILSMHSVKDATAGFRAWRSETLKGIGLHRILSQGYVFQVEMTFVTWRLAYKIREIPIFFPDRHVGESKMTVPVKIEAALRVWEVRWRHRKLTRRDRLAE